MVYVAVTGTNTDVGKTIAAAALAVVLRGQGYPVSVIKPVQTGEPDGCGDIYTVAGFADDIDVADFVRYPEPLSPHLAAERAGMPLKTARELAELLRDHVEGLPAVDEETGLPRIVLVEGAGGLLVKIGDNCTLVDLATELGAPLVVVTSTGLGSLNLAQLTVEAAAARGVETLAVVGGSIAPEPDLATRLNIDEFPQATGVPYLGSIRENAGSMSHDEFQAMAQEVLDVAPIVEYVKKAAGV